MKKTLLKSSMALVLCLFVASKTYAQYDWGDAPDSYGTSNSKNGPRHKAPASGQQGVSMGGNQTGYKTYNIDFETDGIPSINADGDDKNNNPNDEDGLQTPSNPLTISGTTYSISVGVSNMQSTKATLAGWIDFNGNGIFDLGERASTTVNSYASGTITLTWTNVTFVKGGLSYIRLRVAYTASEVTNPTGLANSGEVEDYAVQLTSAGNPPIVTPVNYSRPLSATLQKNVASLTWATAQEINNKGFYVQRSSNHGNFTNIGFVNSEATNGNTASPTSYSFNDSLVQFGTHYYRLQQVDINGFTAQSTTVYITYNNGTATLQLYPNPAGAFVNVANVAIGSVIRIVGMDGRIYNSLVATYSSLQVDISGLSAAMYMVQIKSKENNEFVTLKFVKK